MNNIIYCFRKKKKTKKCWIQTSENDKGLFTYRPLSIFMYPIIVARLELCFVIEKKNQTKNKTLGVGFANNCAKISKI